MRSAYLPLHANLRCNILLLASDSHSPVSAMETSAKSSMLALVVLLQFVVVLTERRVITRVDPPPDDCTAVNCSWGDWSSWGPCDQPCGDTGVSSRTRSVTTRDSCGGRPCDGEAEETRECNRGCRNGGTPRHGRCHCTNEFWGKCCESGMFV